MLRGKTILLGALALAAAIAAGFLAQNWLSSQRAQFEAALAQRSPAEVESNPAVEVLIAAETMATGTFLKPEKFKWIAFPEEAVTDTYFVRANVGDETFEGAVARRPLAAGEPITHDKIVRPGERGFLAAVLVPGMRAVSVPINATTGISGFVFPGDAVDLLLTATLELGGRERRVSETVLADVRVLAVDQRTDDQEGEPELAKTATLEVGPKQAEVVAVALQIGTLSLALRALSSEEDVNQRTASEGTPEERKQALSQLAAIQAGEIKAEDTPSVTWDDDAASFIFGRAAKVTPGVKAAPPATKVRIVRRGEAETQSFSGGW